MQGHLKCWLRRLASQLKQKMILDNHGITIREVADDVDISFGLCQAIFMCVLGMKPAAVKIVPKLQNFE